MLESRIRIRNLPKTRIRNPQESVTFFDGFLQNPESESGPKIRRIPIPNNYIQVLGSVSDASSTCSSWTVYIQVVGSVSDAKIQKHQGSGAVLITGFNFLLGFSNLLRHFIYLKEIVFVVDCFLFGFLIR